MPSVFEKLGGALRRTIDEALTNQQGSQRNVFRQMDGYHALLRAFYANTVYEDVEAWSKYKSRYRLPRSLRSIYNPTRRAVDFYSGAVYPGAWTEDANPTSSGRPCAIRFSPEDLANRQALILPAMQFFDWGNWNAKRMTYVREGAKLGSVFIQIVDDVETGKVRPELVSLDDIEELEVSLSGNVKAFTISYDAEDEQGAYRYRKEVTRDSITIWRGEAIESEEANPYGFAPGVWVRHRDIGGLFGAPAIDGVIPKIDEMNRVATGIHNYIQQLQKQPTIFWSANPPISLAHAARGARKNDPSTEVEAAAIEESLAWLWGNDPQGRTGPLMQGLPMGDAIAELGKLQEEVEADLPEVTLSKELRSIPNLTGPGAERIAGDAASRLYEAEANYDAGTVKALQMGVAIGGWRAQRGDWGGRSSLTRQQQKFLPFNLESYAAGELDATLMERPLFEQTDVERFNALTLKKAAAGLPDEQIQAELGYGPDQRKAFQAMNDAQAQRSVIGAF